MLWDIFHPLHSQENKTALFASKALFEYKLQWLGDRSVSFSFAALCSQGGQGPGGGREPWGCAGVACSQHGAKFRLEPEAKRQLYGFWHVNIAEEKAPAPEIWSSNALPMLPCHRRFFHPFEVRSCFFFGGELIDSSRKQAAHGKRRPLTCPVSQPNK